MTVGVALLLEISGYKSFHISTCLYP